MAVEMKILNPMERSRTYIYRGGYTYRIEDVVAVKVEDGWDRLQTKDGTLHTVLTVIRKGDTVIDYCVAREIEAESWSF